MSQQQPPRQRERAKTALPPDYLNWAVDPSVDPFSVWKSHGHRPNNPIADSINSSNSNASLLESLKRELEVKEEDLQMAAEIGQAVLANFHKLKEEYENHQQQVEMDRLHLQQQHQAEIGHLQKRYQEVERKCAALKLDNSELEEQMCEMRAKQQELDSQLHQISSPRTRRITPTQLRSPNGELESQVDLMEAEIDRSRRNETVLERRLMETRLKLKSLQQESDQQTRQLNSDLDQLKQSNEKLQREKAEWKSKYEQATVDAQMDRQPKEHDSTLAAIIRELSEVNDKLVREKSELQRLLEDTQNQLQQMEESQLIAAPSTPDLHSQSRQSDAALTNTSRISVFGELETALRSNLTSPIHASSRSALSFSRETSPVRDRSSSAGGGKRLSSTSRTSFHENELSSPIETLSLPPNKLLSNLNSEDAKVSEKIVNLNEIVLVTLQRFSNTNTLNLNRRLKKVFDLPSLTQLSNSIIDHILNDVVSFPTKLLKQYPENGDSSYANLVKTIVAVLTEIGQLRKSCNEVGLAFYNKMTALSKVEVDKMDIDRERNQLLQHIQSTPQQPQPPGTPGTPGTPLFSLRRSVSQSIQNASTSVMSRMRGSQSDNSLANNVAPSTPTPIARASRNPPRLPHSSRPMSIAMGESVQTINTSGWATPKSHISRFNQSISYDSDGNSSNRSQSRPESCRIS